MRDDITARAKAGKCYYPIQDQPGIWRNYHYYARSRFVPPSARPTYELIEMERVTKHKPVDEEEYPGIIWAAG
jgi:hypothetical protein